MSDPDTLAFYDREAGEYVKHFVKGSARFIDGFAERLQPRAQILELGCGSGRDAQQFLQRGFSVEMTDGSAGMADEARKLTGQDVRQMRFDELEVVEGYDAVWAHASLHHQPLAGLGEVLARVHRALRPGGWFFANYKLGQGDARDAFGRLYNFAPRQVLLDLYADTGWQLEDVHDYRDGGLDKVMRDWIAITARKATA